MKTILVILFFVMSNYIYSQINRFYVSKDHCVGYINQYDTLKIPFIYNNARQFSEGLAGVALDDKYGYIDTNGNVKIQFQFDNVFDFKDNTAQIEMNKKYGLINRKGKIKIKPKYDWIKQVNEGMIAVQKEKKWALFDSTGKQITDFIFNYIGNFKDGLVDVEEFETELYGFINKKGKYYLKPIYRHVQGNFSNGFCSVIFDNNKNGYIDKKGKLAFGRYFDGCNQFFEGIAIVQETWDGPEFFMDTCGNYLFNISFKSSWFFSEGFCGIESDSMYHVVDNKGKILFSSKEIELRFYTSGIGYFCDLSKETLSWGIMNEKQEILSDIRFLKIFNLNNSPFSVIYISDDPKIFYQSGKRKYITKDGRIFGENIIEP